MLIGHAGAPSFMHIFIYQFHMPLFFFLSGYCLKDKYLNDFKTFSIRRVKGIYIPFIKYSLLFLLLHNIFFNLNIYNDVYGYNGNVSQLYTLNEITRRVVKITTSMSHEEQLLGGFWFLRVLFCTSFIGYAFFKFLKSNKAKIAGVSLIYVSVVVLSYR